MTPIQKKKININRPTDKADFRISTQELGGENNLQSVLSSNER